MTVRQEQDRTRQRGIMRAAAVACLVCQMFIAAAAPAQEDAIKLVEAKRIELKEKEEALKREEARLAALRKDVDEKIAAYTRLVSRVDALLARLERVEGDKIENVVKAYEIMPAEDAAVRLAALDSETALRIMTRMKSKKAGAIIAAMPPQKAAALTKSMARQATKPRQQ